MKENMPAFQECCVLLTVKETTAAGFKGRESLCFPQFNK